MSDISAPYDLLVKQECISTVYCFCVMYCLAQSKIKPIDHIFAEIMCPENKDWMDLLIKMLGVRTKMEACKYFLIADEDGTVATSRKVSYVLSKVLGQRTISEVERDDAHNRYIKRKENAAKRRAEAAEMSNKEQD